MDNGYAVHIEPAAASDSACCGDVCLSVNGDGEKSYIAADYYRFMREFIADSKLGVTQESVLFGFRENGNLPNTVVGSIHNNQLRFGPFWDHWECGHHYTRPMSSWSTLLAVSGLSIDYENKKLRFKPINKNITFPLVIPGVLAKVTFTDSTPEIQCIQGNLDGWEICAE